MNSLDMSTVTGRRETDPPVTRTRSGYGSKLPTSHMLRLGSRWHRVYAICWGTGATCYIIQGGKPAYIATGEL